MSGRSASSAGEPRRPRRVVLAIDGTPADAATLRTAILETRDRPASVHLIRCFPPARAELRSSRAGAAQHAEELAAARHLERLRAMVAEALPGLPVTAALTTGQLARTLVAASRTADVVVLREAPTGAPTDAVAQEVARHAWCPVLLDRPGRASGDQDEHGLRGIPGAAADDTGGVVVGVGDVSSAPDLLSAAADQAAIRGTGLLVVHARPTRAPVRADLHTRHPAAHSGARSVHRPAEDTEQLLTEVVEGVRIGNPEVPVEFRRVEGPAGGALVVLSRGADLLVVGRPHRTGLLPRTTAVALEQATGPVLVVPVASTGTGSAGYAAPRQDLRPADPPPLPAPLPSTPV